MQLELSGIKKVEELAQATPGSISLAQGAVRINGVDTRIKDFLRKILTTTRADYYQTTELLNLVKDKTISWLERKYNAHLEREQLLVSHGCIGALSALFLTILKPGDDVLIPEPAYPLYAQLAQMAHANAVFAPLHSPWTPERWPDFFESIQSTATKKTKILILSNPCNPTGFVIPQQGLLNLALWCSEKKIYLIVDEVYEDFAFTKYHSVTPLLKQSPWVIRASSLSKNFAMSGMRIGHAAMDPALCKRVEATQHALTICPSSLGQWAAVYALDHQELTAPYIATIQKHKDSALAYFNDIGLITIEPSNGGIYLMLNTHSFDTAALSRDILTTAKVALVPGSVFGPSANKHLRLCLARETPLFHEAIKRLMLYWK